ncbi:MAG: GNAT family N-acetyltransferase [Rubrivivax sp.]
MSGEEVCTAGEYRIRVHDDPDAVDAQAWDELLLLQRSPTPFMRHAWLAAMHRSASAVPETGWSPRLVVLERGSKAVAAAALYLKAHSYGEYVFDWAWADAYRRHGLRYYPKLLGASPFTPVPGTRLLAGDEAARLALARALPEIAREAGLSSAHLLFVDEADRRALAQAGWMIRQGVQFHWQADPEQPCPDFEALLARMQRHKRKNILQERRRVAEAGVTFSVHEGPQIDDALWAFFHACYTRTYEAHGSSPYLHESFFLETSRTLPGLWLMFVAHRGGRLIGASLVAIDRQTGVAWGRYWGCTEHLPCLHFEACYYQPLQWCLAQGFTRFEGGAQGEHKMARGLLPVATHSAHWLSDARFADAVADFLAREGAGVQAYVDELRERNPFRD